jgi:hypothetical protein
LYSCHTRASPSADLSTFRRENESAFKRYIRKPQPECHSLFLQADTAIRTLPEYSASQCPIPLRNVDSDKHRVKYIIECVETTSTKFQKFARTPVDFSHIFWSERVPLADSRFRTEPPVISQIIDRAVAFNPDLQVGSSKNLGELPCNEISFDRIECANRLQRKQIDDTQPECSQHDVSPPQTPTESAIFPEKMSLKKRWGLAEWPAEDAESPADRRRRQVREAVRRNREKKGRCIPAIGQQRP